MPSRTTAFVATTADTAINSTTDISIVSTNITVSAGSQLYVRGSFIIENNSTATRVYVITLDGDATGDVEISTGALATSSTLFHPFFFEMWIDIRASNLTWATVDVRGQLAAGIASGGDTTMAATHLEGKGYWTTTSDLTGTCTVSFSIRSAAATATQICHLTGMTVDVLTP